MRKQCKQCGEKFTAYNTIDAYCYECKKERMQKARKLLKKPPLEFKKPRVSRIKKKKVDYKEVYRKFFGYEKGEIIYCEVSGEVANDIHHIKLRSQNGKDVIENLIALARRIHNQAHFKEEPYITAEELQKIHNERMKGLYLWKIGE